MEKLIPYLIVFVFVFLVYLCLTTYWAIRFREIQMKPLVESILKNKQKNSYLYFVAGESYKDALSIILPWKILFAIVVNMEKLESHMENKNTSPMSEEVEELINRMFIINAICNPISTFMTMLIFKAIKPNRVGQKAKIWEEIEKDNDLAAC